MNECDCGLIIIIGVLNYPELMYLCGRNECSLRVSAGTIIY